MSVTVVKIGGALLSQPSAMAEVWAGVSRLRAAGGVVVVHGGGPQSTALARRLGHEPRVVAGRRVTGALDLDIALWAMRGDINARLVAAARAAGVPAVGLSGVDGALVTVTRRPAVEVDREIVDFGHVGDVVGCDPRVVDVLLGAGFVPVVAPVCADTAGTVYNVNADTVALTIAGAMRAQALLMVAEAGGVLRMAGDGASSVLPRLDAASFAAGLREGWIGGGMRPKLEAGFEALGQGVGRVRVVPPAGVAHDAAGTTLL